MQAKTYSSLKDAAQYIKGVGPRRFELLKRLGISTIEDLLYYFPRRYEDRSKFTPISKLAADNYYTVKGEIQAKGLRKAYRRRFSIFEIAIADETGVIYVVWFNQPYMANIFKVGEKIILYGKVQDYQKRLQINAPEYEILDEEQDKAGIHTGRIVPIYPLTENITQRWLRKIIKQTIDEYGHSLPECLPKSVKFNHKLTDIGLAIKNIHFPKNENYLNGARRRLVFEEFFMLQLALAVSRVKKTTPGISHKAKDRDLEDFKKILPFELTRDQLRVIKEIQADMARPSPMNRLLQGEVGSGKTIVSAYAFWLAIKNGYQGALMAPTEILAQQHYITFSELFLPQGINVVLLINGLSPQEKANAVIGIQQGEADIVIGTHALIQEKVNFKALGLVVVDEQHKFGVMQRTLLKNKGLNPDLLIMSATPIPRTLALTLYGDLDISTIKELPPERLPVATYWIPENRREGVYRFLKEQIREGRQAYVVFPLIEKTNRVDTLACTAMYEESKKGIFADLKIGILHGKLEPKEKESVMKRFKKREIDILFATTILEVGIDVPNAAVMVVENAQRFGLSQLHQLRGRIGRGPERSYCFLVADATTQEGQARLSAMVQTKDGFALAERDLSIRGPGEFFGTRQSGFPQLKIGDLLKDLSVLEVAKREAARIIGKDAHLSSLENKLLKHALFEKFPSLTHTG
ncbi:MAG: ATP-dependent DNA helicase RecG [Candidatus Omnitrophota bacterium]